MSVNMTTSISLRRSKNIARRKHQFLRTREIPVFHRDACSGFAIERRKKSGNYLGFGFGFTTVWNWLKSLANW